MGMSAPRKGGGRRQPMAEINVTPLVDVMLVLLIIFMVTAPLLVSGVPVDLPDAKAQSLPQDNTPIQISLNGQGEVFIDQLAVAPAALGAKLTALRQARSDDARVYVRADRGLDYGRVMQVVGEVNAAGFKKVALVTDGQPSPTP
ncbi:MAG: protein TolR [Pseudomonadota bacterium]